MIILLLDVAILDAAAVSAGTQFPENWATILLSTLAMLTGVVLFTAALEVWLKRILGSGEGPTIRRSATLTLPAGADPNAEPRGRLIPQENVGRRSGGVSQMNPRPDRHRRIR